MKNSNPSDLLKKTLLNRTNEKDATNDDFDIIDVVPIPMHGDRMVRLRTLEEALNDFDNGGDSNSLPVMGYFVQVKPRKTAPPTTPKSAPVARQAQTQTPIQDQTRTQNQPPLQSKARAATQRPTFDEPHIDVTPVRTRQPQPLAEPTVATTSHLPKKTQASQAEQASQATPSSGVAEGIYLSDGKLNLPILMRSAEMLYSSGDFALARNIYKAMLSSGEKTGNGLLGMARCYEAEGRLEEARINYEESIAYHPQAEAYKSLTSLLIRQKKDQQAAEVIERALHHRDFDGPNRYELHKTAGNCWSRINNLKEAERHYRKALEIRPDADEMCTNLGALYLQHGQTAEAERHFQDALASNPKSHQALTGLGSCALADNNKLAAHAWFARSLQVEIKNPTAIFHLVKCAYEIKNYAVAARILEDYIQVAPVNAHLMYSLAGLQYHLGRVADAAATCTKILQLNPEHVGARDLLNRIGRDGASPNHVSG